MNYKKMAAVEAARMVRENQLIGLGAGSTVAYLAHELTDNGIARTLRFVSSSVETTALLQSMNLNFMDAGALSHIDIYFDGCDQLDHQLNAWKSGGGIHTDEKALAGLAHQFVLLGDSDKYVHQLTPRFPMTIEVIPSALGAISEALKATFDISSVAVRTNANQHHLTKRGCALLEASFNTLPELSQLNQIKLWPGVIDHSLFYQLATDAIVCGGEGSQWIKATSRRETYSLLI